jgi:hypothetical protein
MLLGEGASEIDSMVDGLVPRQGARPGRDLVAAGLAA